MMLKTLFFCLMLPGAAFASDWDVLKEPGTIAIMRHALAPGIGNPAGFVLDACATQRNLDVRGQDQARKIGAAMRENGIAFDRVLTSQWCRTRETARLLAVGPVTDAPALNSFFEDASTRDSQTQAVLDLIAGAGEKLMLVTHQVNISALTGQGVQSGEVVVIRMTQGRPEVVGRIQTAP